MREKSGGGGRRDFPAAERALVHALQPGRRSDQARLARAPDCRRSDPWVGAVRRPALVRSAMSARSSCATAPSICRENMPCGVVVSTGSCRLRKCAPWASSGSMIESRWATERARRSSRTTTKLSPGLISRSSRARTVRLRLAPEACSWWMALQPAAGAHRSVDSTPCSSVGTRA